MESLSVTLWGCFLGHITHVFVKVSLLWGMSGGSWVLGLVWREIEQRPGGRSSRLGAVTGQAAWPLCPSPAMVGDAVP